MKYKIGDKVLINWKKQIIDSASILYNTYTVEGCGAIFSESRIEWLVEKEWTPKEGEYVRAIDGGAVSNCIFLFLNKEWKPVCVWIWDERNYEMWDDSYTVTTWEGVEQIKQEKKERKLMMTNKEWDEFQKNNNLN